MTNNDVQNSTQKTKDQATPTVRSSESISRVTLVTNPVIDHEQGKERVPITINGTFPWSFMTKIFNNG